MNINGVEYISVEQALRDVEHCHEIAACGDEALRFLRAKWLQKAEQPAPRFQVGDWVKSHLFFGVVKSIGGGAIRILRTDGVMHAFIATPLEPTDTLTVTGTGVRCFIKFGEHGGYFRFGCHQDTVDECNYQMSCDIRRMVGPDAWAKIKPFLPSKPGQTLVLEP